MMLDPPSFTATTSFPLKTKRFLFWKEAGDIYRNGNLELNINILNSTMLVFTDDGKRKYFVRDAAVETIVNGRLTHL